MEGEEDDDHWHHQSHQPGSHLSGHRCPAPGSLHLSITEHTEGIRMSGVEC